LRDGARDDYVHGGEGGSGEIAAERTESSNAVFSSKTEKLFAASFIARYICKHRTMNYSISCSPKKVSVVVRGPFNFMLFAFLPIWLAAWVYLIPKTTHTAEPQSIMPIVLFGIFALLFVYAWLWNLAGREEIEFTINGLTYKRVLLGLSYSRVFRMSRISNPHFENSRRNGRSRTPSGIGFSYGGSEVRICDHLTQRASKEIVAAVLQEIPEVRKYWGNYAEGLPEESEDLSLRLT
jgi:hypothetical protein